MWFSCFCILPRSAKAQVIWGGIVKRLLIAYFICNISTKKCQNPFMCVKVTASQRWDVFETRCTITLSIALRYGNMQFYLQTSHTCLYSLTPQPQSITALWLVGPHYRPTEGRRLSRPKYEWTRMRADAQRHRRPAEYRWRPLLNAAVWLTHTTRVPCSNAANIEERKDLDAKWILHLVKFVERRWCSNEAKTRNPLKFVGVAPNLPTGLSR